jgi:RNase P subunit RPR2
MKALSSSAVKEIREISYVEQIKPSVEIKRSVCKKCNVYLVPDRNGKPAIKLSRKRNRMIRECLNCGHKVSYLWNPNYKSRNEQACEDKE